MSLYDRFHHRMFFYRSQLKILKKTQSDNSFISIIALFLLLTFGLAHIIDLGQFGVWAKLSLIGANFLSAYGVSRLFSLKFFDPKQKRLEHFGQKLREKVCEKAFVFELILVIENFLMYEKRLSPEVLSSIQVVNENLKQALLKEEHEAIWQAVCLAIDKLLPYRHYLPKQDIRALNSEIRQTQLEFLLKNHHMETMIEQEMEIGQTELKKYL